MRKKELLKQNQKLFDNLTMAELKIAELKKVIEACETKISAQKTEIEELNAKLNATEPLKILENKVLHNTKTSSDVDYGAVVIGKTVVEAAKCCNSLTNAGNSESAKELVNLILGRTEVAKAEILKIVSSDAAEEDKKQKINMQYDEAVDYFKSIMAQI